MWEDTQPFPTVPGGESTVYSHPRTGSGVFSFCFPDFPRHFFSCQSLWHYHLDWLVPFFAGPSASLSEALFKCFLENCFVHLWCFFWKLATWFSLFLPFAYVFSFLEVVSSGTPRWASLCSLVLGTLCFPAAPTYGSTALVTLDSE